MWKALRDVGMSNNFIDLNRSFSPISKDHTFDEDDDASRLFDRSFRGFDTKKWDDLLELPRVIILAEAGAGKTWEIEATTKKLRAEGKKAFFFRLEHLASEFASSFEIGEKAEFDEWLIGDELGWFFLDSVDEARLTGPKQFEQAIRKFGAELGASKQRACIYITSRISEWRPQSDLELVKKQLPFDVTSDQKNQNTDSDFTFIEGTSNKTIKHNVNQEREQHEPAVFALCPLDSEQIRIFSQGVQDLEVFLEAIEKHEANIFSTRPQDLKDLIAYWKKNGEIANLEKLIEASINSKLKEEDPDRASTLPLTDEEARYGAEMLAASVTFLKKNRILVPDCNTDSIRAEAIDSTGILTDWDFKKIQALLQRPIFDEAIYGTVRFHHRSVREYLTAQWLYRLLQERKSRRAIESLFFTERYGQQVVVPSLRPVLAWLILFDDGIREKTAKIAPEIFIQGGDPSALPTEIRQSMLIQFCERYVSQKVLSFGLDNNSVQRFAHPDLGQTVNDLLNRYCDHEEIQDLLLRIVWLGNIQVCSEQALSCAVNERNGVYTRIYGIRIIRTVGSQDQKNRLLDAITTNSNVKDGRLAGELISAFSPGLLGSLEIINLIKSTELKQRDYGYSFLEKSLRKFCQYKCPENNILEWIQNLLPLLKEPPISENYFHQVSEKYGWLLPCLVLAAERLVCIQHPDTLDQAVIETISLIQEPPLFMHYDKKENTLAELVPKWSELNHALFWVDIKSARRYKDSKNSERWNHWRSAGVRHHFWKFTVDDFEKILQDIAIKPDIDDRLVALSLAFQIYIDSGRGRSRRAALKKAVFGVPELEEALTRFLKPPPMSEEDKRWRRYDADYKRKQKRQKKREIENRQRWDKWLQENINVLCDTSIAAKGHIWKATNYLRRELEYKDSGSDKNWQDLISEFGQDVAEAYRDGCIGYWREYRPKIRSEDIEDSNSIPIELMVGLSGLEIESHYVSNWPRNLSKDEVNLACRYAMNELNAFSNWLPKLHVIFPEIVESAILAEVEWEFAHYDGNDLCHYVLSRVAWHLDTFQPKIATKILHSLEKYEPKHDSTVQRALEIVLASADFDQSAFSGIAKSKVNSITSHSRLAVWIAAWMGVDAQSAFDNLSLILKGIDNTDHATNFLIQFIAALIGDRLSQLKSQYQDYVRPEILLPLIKLMHTYIRSSEDIDRTKGSAYSPTPRDDAQSARDRLSQLLINIPGKATYQALIELSQSHPDEHFKRWYILEAKQRAEADAEFYSWQSGDIKHFAKEAEKTPHNHRELFNLTLSRLFDLRHDLEDGDASNAALLQLTKDETMHRIYIGNWLRERSLGRYSVPQEEELADAKRPDIRIHGFGFDGPIPIELKIACSWTGSQFVERLNNQLCGQYFRDNRSNCGIFLLVDIGNKKHWKHPQSRQNLDFDSLIQLLREEAAAIIARDNKIESVEIVGINLSKRNSIKLISGVRSLSRE
jgi:hypothetical protein